MRERLGDIPQARTELDRGRGERVLSPKFSRRLGPNRSSWATIDSSRAIVPTSPAGDGLGERLSKYSERAGIVGSIDGSAEPVPAR
jgi:hypothetical protein